MKFQEYTTSFQRLRAREPELRRVSDEAMKAALLKHFNNSFTAQLELSAEETWIAERRPYYRIWPGITEVFAKFKFDKVLADQCRLPYGLFTLACHFSEPLAVEFNGKFNDVWSMLIFNMNSKDKKQHRFGVVSHSQEGDEIGNIAFSLLHDNNDNQTIESLIGKIRTSSRSIRDFMEMTLRISIGISLIDQNQGIITADVLADDRDKYARGDAAERERLADRARRRGKFGFDVGKAMYEARDVRDVSAHYRHPHWAIRWTGEGGKTPRLRPIKGSFVHRDKIITVPTGYLD